MMANIIIEPANVWAFFTAHKEDLQFQTKLIAENPLFGVEIYLAASSDFATFTVIADGFEVYEEYTSSATECSDIVNEIYSNYLTDNAIDALNGGDNIREPSTSEEIDMIEERELELDEAVYTLLEAFVPDLFDVVDDSDEVFEGLKDCICEYLYKQHAVSVFRPMYLYDDDGFEYFETHPYSEMSFEDSRD